MSERLRGCDYFILGSSDQQNWSLVPTQSKINKSHLISMIMSLNYAYSLYDYYIVYRILLAKLFGVIQVHVLPDCVGHQRPCSHTHTHTIKNCYITLLPQRM